MDCEQILDDAKSAARKEFDLGREAFAAEVLHAYLRHRPGDSFAWFIYGDALRILGRSREAFRSLRRALKTAPASERFLVWTRLGMLMGDVGRRKAAERWFARACDDSRSQDCDWLWVIRGANLAVTERHTEAEHCLKKAIKINPRNDEAYLNLGTLYRAIGRFEDAHRALRHGYLLDPASLAIQKALDSVASIGEAKVWVDQLESEGAQRHRP